MRTKEMKNRVVLAGVVLVALMFCVDLLMLMRSMVDPTRIEVLLLVLLPLISLSGCVIWVMSRPVCRPKSDPEAVLFTRATAKNMWVLYIFFGIVCLITIRAQQLGWDQWVVTIISIMALPLFLVFKATVGSQGYWFLLKKHGEEAVLQYYASREAIYTMTEQFACVGVAISIPHSGLFRTTWVKSNAGWRIKRVWFGEDHALLIDQEGVGVPLWIDSDGDHRLVNSTFDLAKLLLAGNVCSYNQLLLAEKDAEIADLNQKLRFQIKTGDGMQADLEAEYTKRWGMIEGVFRAIALLGKMPRTKMAREALQEAVMVYVADEDAYEGFLAKAKAKLSEGA